jgi:D-lactate dehydrogenase
MRIAVFEAEQWEHEACLQLATRHEIFCTSAALSERTAREYADVEILVPFVYSALNASVLSSLPRLKLIATRSTGYDHIDLGYARAHGITVCNVPDYGDSTVAEHVFALLLGIARFRRLLNGRNAGTSRSPAFAASSCAVRRSRSSELGASESGSSRSPRASA